MLELIFLPLTLIPALLSIAVVAGIIYVIVLLFAPLVAWLDAGKECDQKYAFDRWRRAEEYKQLNASLYSAPASEKPLSRRQAKLKRALERQERKKLQRKETKRIESTKTNS